jgi:hypothetical protein
VTIETKHAQRFPVATETYWRDLCLSLEYQERLYCEALGCTRMDVVEHRGNLETGITRKLRFEKPLEAPSAIRKVFGDAITLQEESVFDAAKQTWSFKMIPAVLGDRVDIRGIVTVRPTEDGVEQLSISTVSCKLFGVGSIVEHFVAKSTHEGNADKAGFTRRYIEEKGLR